MNATRLLVAALLVAGASLLSVPSASANCFVDGGELGFGAACVGPGNVCTLTTYDTNIVQWGILGGTGCVTFTLTSPAQVCVIVHDPVKDCLTV